MTYFDCWLLCEVTVRKWSYIVDGDSIWSIGRISELLLILLRRRFISIYLVTLSRFVWKSLTAGLGARALLFFCTWSDQFAFANNWLLTIKIIQPSKFVSAKGKQLDRLGCFEDVNKLLQTVILQHFQEVGFIKQHYIPKYCKISQGVEFIKHHYRLKYWNIVKRWNL